jgi:hypothetical protein
VRCPRCGAEVQEGDRFCASCGADVGRESKPPRSRRERVRGLIGKTRRERVITAATAGAIVVAIVAFIVIFITTEDVEEGEVPQDEYTLAADDLCEQSKLRVGAALSSARSIGLVARELVVIVAEWRSAFNDLEVPDDRVELAAALDTALREVESGAGAMARAGREGDRGAVLERAQEVDAATAQVEQAVDDLALERCSETRFVLGQPPG